MNTNHSIDVIYQDAIRGEADIGDYADHLIQDLDSSDSERANTAAKTLVEFATDSPTRLMPYANRLISKLITSNAPEKTAKAVSRVARVFPEETFDYHRESLVEVLEADYSDRTRGWILEALIPDIKNHTEYADTIIRRATELLEAEDPTVIVSAVEYLTQAARYYPATLSKFDKKLLKLRSHNISLIRIGAFGILSRLSRHDSSTISGEDFAADLATELSQYQNKELVRLIEATELTVIGTPGCWEEFEHNLYPLLASESDIVQRQTCKSLLSVVAHHPTLPSNPNHLYNRLSDLAAEFQLPETYGQQIDQALNRLSSRASD